MASYLSWSKEYKRITYGKSHHLEIICRILDFNTYLYSAVAGNDLLHPLYITY